MNAEVIAIGTELLLGFVVNTDTAYLGRVLAGLGISCWRHVTIGDNPERLAEALRTALARADLVITCGGLGPTVDDVTLETIARVTGRRLVLRRDILREIQRRFRRRGIRMPPSNRRQALLPTGAIPFPNRVGTAPGFILKLPVTLRQAQSDRLAPVRGELVEPRTQLLVALPGPPAELMPMVERHLVPRLKRYTGGQIILSRTLRVVGLSESEVDARVRDLLALAGAVTVGIYAHAAQVDLRVTARAASRHAAERLIRGTEGKIRKRLGRLIFGADEETLEGTVGRLLEGRRSTLAVAESCTGGLVSDRITAVPGSSAYFVGGVVAYSNAMKQDHLGVSRQLLARHGAVSRPVALAMARGIRRATGAELGLAVTGIAGPAGGSRAKPVGLTHIALSGPRRQTAERHLFSGDRATVKFKASQAALNLLRLHLVRPRSRSG